MEYIIHNTQSYILTQCINYDFDMHRIAYFTCSYGYFTYAAQTRYVTDAGHSTK